MVFCLYEIGNLVMEYTILGRMTGTMNKLYVAGQITTILGFMRTVWTREWPFAGVCSQVFLESRHKQESSLAERAHERRGV